MLPVETWFGEHFSLLHPLLQKLHRQGGVLRGHVNIEIGTGIAGVLAKRLLAKFGIQMDSRVTRSQLEVMIQNDDEGLHWVRKLNNAAAIESVFIPYGAFGRGFWLERSGAMQLKLDVDVINGAWRWRQISGAIFGVPVPRWILPRVEAGKRIDGESYIFDVSIALPLTGQLLAYNGRLQLLELA